jgi:hypothetical protein
MNRGRVGEERGGKETDGCPLTPTSSEMKGEWEQYPSLSHKCLDYQQFSLIIILKSTYPLM